MKKLLLSTLALSAAMAALPSTAQAENWYLGGSVGYNNTSGQTSEGEGRLVETEFDDGFVTSSFVGYKFDNSFRAEASFDWRKNDGESLSFNGTDRPFTAKGAESYSLMLTGFYDFEIDAPVTPYVGAGAGFSRIDNEFLYGPVTFEDRDTVFAWQVAAGLSMPVTDKIDAFIDSRYFSGASPEFVRTSPADNGVVLESEYDNFSVSVGYRWNF